MNTTFAKTLTPHEQREMDRFLDRTLPKGLGLRPIEKAMVGAELIVAVHQVEEFVYAYVIEQTPDAFLVQRYGEEEASAVWMPRADFWKIYDIQECHKAA